MKWYIHDPCCKWKRCDTTESMQQHSPFHNPLHSGMSFDCGRTTAMHRIENGFEYYKKCGNISSIWLLIIGDGRVNGLRTISSGICKCVYYILVWSLANWLDGIYRYKCIYCHEIYAFVYHIFSAYHFVYRVVDILVYSVFLFEKWNGLIKFCRKLKKSVFGV